MPKKSKIRCEFKTPGDKKVMFQLFANAEGFGDMKCNIQYSLENDAMTAIVAARAEAAQKSLDGIEVDPSDDESVGAYVMACMGELSGLFGDIKEAIATTPKE